MPPRAARSTADDPPPWLEVEETSTSSRHPEKRREVVRAALRIADREGFAAVSMRRVAAELGWGTMTLYSYVSNKDQLIALMAEELGSELLLAEPLPADWKEAMVGIARRTRQMLLDHRWIATVRTGAFLGPAFARHVDQTFAALAPLRVDAATMQGIARSVDAYTMGCALSEIERGRPGSEERKQQLLAHARRLADREELPHLARALDEGGLLTRSPVEQFEQGLAWLLAGIEHSLAR
jgi:AcrR family transcriptional regulator